MSSDKTMKQKALDTINWISGTVVPTTTHYVGKTAWGIVIAGLVVLAPLLYAHGTDEQAQIMRQEYLEEMKKMNQ